MAKNNDMSKGMIDNIKNYGEKIVTLKDFVEAVRQNPGYHLGSKGNKGFINMIREVLQNALDELDKDASPCDEVSFGFDERLQGVTVVDNGRGIPFGNILRIFTDPNTSSNFNKIAGEYSSGQHGVGAKVTNAMSAKFIIESYILGKARRVEFTEGYPWDKGEVEVKAVKYQGTMIYFQPSTLGLGDVFITWRDAQALIKLILPLSKIGAKLHFTGIDVNGKEYHEDMVNTDGIMTYLNSDLKSPVIQPIQMFKDTGHMKLDIAFTWDTSDSSSSKIISFSNKCPTTLGTHIDGFDKGVTSFFVNYMNKVYLASQKKNKISIIPTDVRAGLKAVVSVSHLKPIFDGQSKEKLANADMDPFVKGTVSDILDQWCKSNPKEISKICKYLKDIADIRLSVDTKRIKLTDKYSKSKLTNLPAKFVGPTGDPNVVKTECFIVEGDSAGGHMKNHRNNITQGYFPIRGKIPNAFKTSKDKFLGNAEVAGIITIIGGGYGKDFDITKVKWDKIIIGTDADADGAHIAVLLERFFILYMPGLIESGKLYKAVPPLYSIGGKKRIYIHNKTTYIKYVQDAFIKNNTVADISGTPLNPKQLSAYFYRNSDYTYEMKKLCDLYAVDPTLLEIVLTSSLNGDKFSVLKKKIKKEVRFLDSIEQHGNTISVMGLYKSKYQTIFINQSMLNDCKRVMDILASNDAYVYKLNGNLSTIYEIMLEFDKSSPSSLQRYKGLGEMDGYELFDSTMNPDNRILIQYRIDDLKEELDAIRYYESNNLSDLMVGVKVTRSDLLS